VSTPSMVCNLTNGSGTVQTTDISNITIVCEGSPDYKEIGVNVAGITGSLSVQLNGTDTQVITSDGLRKFSSKLQIGTSFTVTIASQSAGSVCAFEDPALTLGTVASTNITLNIRCLTGYLSGGTIQSSAAANLVNPSPQHFYLRTMVGTYPGISLGFANGPPNTTLFNSPNGMASDGTNVYVADYLNHLIRRIVIATGVSSTLAGGNSGGGVTCPGTVTTACKDGIGTAAQFNGPYQLTTDGTSLYVLEFLGNRIRKINLATGAVTTLAGDGTTSFADNANGLLASFSNPHGITLHNGMLYVSDRYNNRIRLVNPITSAVTTFAGDGSAITVDGNGTSASLFNPVNAVALGGYLYFTDLGGNRIRRIDLSGANAVTTIAGNGMTASVDGYGLNAQFSGPFSLATDGTDLFIADYNTYKIRHLRISDTKVTTLVGGGTSGYVDNASANARMNQPVFLLSDGSHLYVSDAANHSLRRLQNAELLRYTFDTNIDDSIGTNHGTFVGSVSTPVADENGTTNGAREFDGIAQYIRTGGGISWEGSPVSDVFTISLWVFPSNATTDTALFYNGTEGANGYGLFMQANTRALFVKLDSGVMSAITSRTLPLNHWSHVTLSRNGGDWQIHIDGINQALTPTFSASPTSLPSGPLRIGSGGATTFFKGKVSDLRFFKGALDDEAIGRLAVQVPSGLVAYYPFNGNTDDYSGNGNHLTATATIPSDDRFKFPFGSYYFNGTTAFMQRTSPAPIVGLPTGTTARTHCAWLRTDSNVTQNIFGYGTASVGNGSGIAIDASNFINDGYFSNFNSSHYGLRLEWVHFCATSVGTTAANYVNGVLQDSGTVSRSTNTSASLQIGRRIDAADPFFGALDDIRIYNRVLSAAEIRVLAGNHPTQVSVWNYAPASSSLKFYLKPESASYGPAACGGGGTSCVSLWSDRSGNGINVFQVTPANQPYVTLGTINGQDAVRFEDSGTPDFLTTSCQPSLIGNTNTIFAVFNELSQSFNNGIFQNGDFIGLVGGKLLYITRGAGNNPTLFNLNANAFSVRSTSNFNSLNESVILALDYNGTSGSILKNGTVQTFLSQATVAPVCNGGSSLHIGRYFYGGPDNHLDGHLGDFLYFDQVLSPSDRNIVNCYLSRKYNIPVSHSCP